MRITRRQLLLSGAVVLIGTLAATLLLRRGEATTVIVRGWLLSSNDLNLWPLSAPDVTPYVHLSE